jgi:hypothetical protein
MNLGSRDNQCSAILPKDRCSTVEVTDRSNGAGMI